ncbi:MAG TPA: hypothetical protein V6D06_12720 [Trichocoleus sp.]
MNWRTDEEQAETDSGRRISLPEPDIENITVLTKSLPNEPILPWHHFDSPWLERDEDAQAEGAEASETEASEAEAAAPTEPALETTLEDSAPPQAPEVEALSLEEASGSDNSEQLALALEVSDTGSEVLAPEAISESSISADASSEEPHA